LATCRHPLRQMSEGFSVCNRARGHCPILVMSPEPKLVDCVSKIVFQSITF